MNENSIINYLTKSREFAQRCIKSLQEENVQLKTEINELKVKFEIIKTEIGIIKNPTKIFYPSYRTFEKTDEMDYVPLRHNSNFEIDPVHYPYPIRNIKNKKQVNEFRFGEYIGVSLDGVSCSKHEILYEQWNEDYKKDPSFVIDHINKNKHDYYKDNLELIPLSKNNENRLTCNGILLDYKFKLSEKSKQITTYKDYKGNVHNFDIYYYDNDTFYKFIDEKRGYKPLTKTPTNNGVLYVKMKNTKDKDINVRVDECKKQLGI